MIFVITILRILKKKIVEDSFQQIYLFLISAQLTARQETLHSETLKNYPILMN
ncbi:hypothetical protein LEP1GSC080_0642 [Leptospira interrogans str. FPW2026]|nr:hypothetical protein LEP1GSC080_0642 [Leptospira interrogans str. FPW2026]